MTRSRTGTVRHAVAIVALCLSQFGTAAAQDAPRVVSELKTLRFMALAELPAAPANRSNGCPEDAVPPQSEAARAVAGRGWTVTGEAPLGRYRAVSFAPDLAPGTSGTCMIERGNVAVFDGARLVALAYGSPGNGTAIGRIAASGDGGARLWDGDIPSAAVAEIRVQADGTLVLGRLAREETVCGGRGAIPNIRDMPIDKARAALIAKGWTPVRAAPSAAGREKELASRGVIEVSGCSGTGLAYCRFDYRGPAGTLSVTSVGEDAMPRVSDYAATCR